MHASKVPTLAALLTSLAITPASATHRAGQAPASEDAQHEDTGRKYAPILWLAQDERTYPMLPHPFAFDGIDNDFDGCFDVRDPDEVVMSWFEIRQVARTSVEQCPAWRDIEAPASCNDEAQPSFCRGCRPACWLIRGRPWGDDDAREVEPQRRVLLAEPTDWIVRRDQLRGQRPTGEATSRQQTPESLEQDLRDQEAAALGGFRVLQYWFYYPFDDGPNAHADDAEHVSLFVAKGATSEGDSIKAFVGAGHGNDSVNNILVTGNAFSRDAIFPRQLSPHTPVLVELGKHASAPDRDCNGRFDLGLDANLYPEGVWGSRDVWSGNVGQALKVGTFRSWFSFARVASDKKLLIEKSWRNDASYARVCLGLNSVIPAALAETRASGERVGAMPAAAVPPLADYSLFPVAVLRQLHERLEQTDVGLTLQVAKVQALLDEHRRLFWDGLPDPGETCRVTPGSLIAMRAWTRGRHASHRDVWKHEYYKRPDDIFRHWLFARVGLGVSNKVEAGNWVTGATLRVAELRLPGFLPMGLGGSQSLHDSRLEAYVHFDGIGTDLTPCGRGRVCYYDAGIDFFAGRNRHTGWYLGVTTKRDYDVKWHGKVGLNGGVEFGLPSLPWRWSRRLSVMASAGASAQLFRRSRRERRDPTSAQADTIEASSLVRANVGVRVTWALPLRFARARHPLVY